MQAGDHLQLAYVLTAFALQLLLIANFAARNLRPELERRCGWILYVLAGSLGLALGVLLWGSDEPRILLLAMLLLSVWGGFGYLIDIRFRVKWRNPPRWSIFIPYVGLFVASQLFQWGSMWDIDRALWVAYGMLYAISTTLNLASHRGKRTAAAQE